MPWVLLLPFQLISTGNYHSVLQKEKEAVEALAASSRKRKAIDEEDEVRVIGGVRVRIDAQSMLISA